MLKMTTPFCTAMTRRLEYDLPSLSLLTISSTRRDGSPLLRK